MSVAPLQNMADQTRDIVMIGSSAGGVEALPQLLQRLPKDFPAGIFIVQHLSATGRPYLVEILSRTSALPVTWAEQGDRIEHGHVYVAPPDVHMLFTDSHLALNRGARENFSRPSIDKAFRSAAAVHGTRTIGVLLTGMLDDGVAGLRAIRDAGGVVIVQDPDDAAFPELPSRALQALAPDHLLPLGAIPQLLQAKVIEAARKQATPQLIALEAALDRLAQATPQELARLGPQSAIICPECAGPTWEIGDEKQRRYRCYLGHVVTAAEVLEHGEQEVEQALWSAVRALEERVMTLSQLARDCERSGNRQSVEIYDSRAKEARHQADLARQFMFDLIRPK
jgi:two-component system chemotaxis response regulator CheB